MRHKFWLLLSALIMFAGAVSAVAEDDTVSLGAALSHTWDSNFSRNHQAESEQISVASVDMALEKTLSRQQFGVDVGAARYRHQRLDQLDATSYQFGANWRGVVGKRLSPSLVWDRRDRLAEREEFSGLDIITRDEKRGGLDYGFHPRWSVFVDRGEIRNTHSNDARERLDFEDEETSYGLRYESEKGAGVALLLVDGSREYPNPERNGLPGVNASDDLDFDYRRIGLESEWGPSDKTSLTGAIVYFDREGVYNDGSGAEANVTAHWQVTSKTGLQLSYLFRQPPLGEDSDNPSEVQKLALAADWQWTQRIRLETGLRLVTMEFSETPARVYRDEEQYEWAPLLVAYRFGRHLDLKLSSTWKRRSSPVTSREYTARELTLGLAARF